MTKPVLTASTLREIADFFGVSLGTVKSWRSRGQVPDAPEGRGYDLQKLSAWLAGRSEARLEAADSSDRARLLRAKADEREARAALAAQDLAEMRRQFRDVAEFRSWWGRMTRVVRARFLRVENALPGILEGRTCREMEVLIRREVRQALTDIATTDTSRRAGRRNP